MRSFFHSLPIANKRYLAQCASNRLDMAAFPVSGKVPLVAAWKPCLTAAGVYGTDEAWALATGYALAPVAGTLLVVLDLDDVPVLDELAAFCPALRETFAVQRGDHQHLYCKLALVPLPAATLKRVCDGREVASLRGVGAYVVGPGSDHASGDQYVCVNEERPVVTLTLLEQTQLIDWFSQPAVAPEPPADPSAPRAIRLHRTHQTVAAEREAITAVARGQGYHAHGEWRNGRCIHPEQHRNGDRHPSFGIHLASGVGHCFVCGSFSPAEVAAALDIAPPVPPAPRAAPAGDRLYAFSTPSLPRLTEIATPSGVPDTEAVHVELNIALALVRQGQHAAARFNDLLFDDSARRHGKHTYVMAELVTLGEAYGLSRSQVDKAVRALVKLGLLCKRAHGLYRRVSLEHAREILNLGVDYARLAIPRAAYSGGVKHYTAALLLEVERLLPGTPATATIGAAAGISAASVYRHENRLGVERITDCTRVGLALATEAHFVKVFDSDKRYVATVSGDDLQYKASKLADAHNGKPWAWQQKPSRRILPSSPFRSTQELSCSP